MQNDHMTLERIVNDPDFNFLNKIQNEDDVVAFEQGQDPASDSPYKDFVNSCNYYDEISLTEKFGQNSNFSAMSFNVQSLPAKFGQLQTLLNNLNTKKLFPSVICLQEIWQLPNDQVFNLNNYHSPIFKCRANNVQGGVLQSILIEISDIKNFLNLAYFLIVLLKLSLLKLQLLKIKNLLLALSIDHQQIIQLCHLLSNITNLWISLPIC